MGPAVFCLCFAAVFVSTFVHPAASEWIYPPITIPEETSSLVNQVIFAALNSDPRVHSYQLCGPGIHDTTCGKGFERIPTEFFYFNKANGQMTLLETLDREVRANYTLTVFAFDNSGAQIGTSSEVVVNVFDTNDHGPVFVESSLVGSVSETGRNDFMQIKTTDEDVGLNAISTYAIVSGSQKPPSSSSSFSIDATTGKVSVIGGLDFESAQTVTFNVSATNKGDGGGASWVKVRAVTVNVEDANDHPPIVEFTPPEPVSELLPVNSSVVQFTASDIDTAAVNHKAYFDIIEGDRNEKFWVQSLPAATGMSDGIIKIRKPLDFETEPTTYNLVIKAYNKEAANSNVYTSTATVTINVADANEPPIFDLTTAIVVTEEVPAPADPATSTVLRKVVAKDLDFGGTQSVTYSIASDPEDWFIIDGSTGEIRRKGKIDREAPSVRRTPEKSTYTLVIMATDDYPEPASGTQDVEVLINDINDHPPAPTGFPNPGDGYNVSVCLEPATNEVIQIRAVDPDSPANGAPFTFVLLSNTEDWELKIVEGTGSTVARLNTYIEDFGSPKKIEIPYSITDSGSITATYTLTVSACECDDNGEPQCGGAIPQAGFPFMIIIAIVVVLLLIIIIIFALLAYKRRKDAMILKEPFFDDEDDIRENIQVYQEEGGEVDQDAYDLSALQVPLMDDPNAPIRVEKPIQQPSQPRLPRGIPDDIGDYIGDAKDQADNDPSAPPFDSLLVFDYEGLGSDAGSLSSINTATTDGSMDYDHLNNWGPRFKRLADMYNNGSDSE